MPVQRCANGIYPGVEDFIVYFGGHLHVIKTSCIKELVYFRLDGLFEAVSYLCEPLLMKFEIEKRCNLI